MVVMQNYTQTKAAEHDDELHDSYIELMDYLQQYKQSICFDSQGVVPNKAVKKTDEDLPSDFDDEDLKAEDIWKVEESGPNKGKLKAVKDFRGNVVVDPVGNIQKDQNLLDFNVYRALQYHKEKQIASNGEYDIRDIVDMKKLQEVRKILH